MINTFEFHNPQFLWLLLLLPAVAYIRKRCKKQATLSFPYTENLKTAADSHRPQSQRILNCLRFLALTLSVFALARPQLIQRFAESNSSGVDIILAVDISSSMMGLDFQEEKERKLTTRLDIAKWVTEEFIQNRPSDRIGMCAFARDAYLVSPVTMNHDWLVDNLKRLHVGLVEDGTAIGNAIAMCANRLKNSESKTKLIVLLTDGSNTAGNIAPLTATESAAALNIKIYTIGIGKKGIIPFAYPDEKGNIVTDHFGRPLTIQGQADLDETLLEAIAKKTEGQFFRAENRKQLSDIYTTIDQLEKTDVKIKQFAIAEDFFLWLIGCALLLLLLECFLRHSKFQKIP
ncbi:MAG: VWA domain-containing protein [Puniceicoccales bacterium]|jgi:Ca-activated chloride channel family protein|nr:VWA domain-containing protein [Puniceicoccales bacterium]